MDFVHSIPKGKNILEFLQELDSEQSLAKDAWHFMHRNIIAELMRQAGVECLVPSLAIADGSGSFHLYYNGQDIGIMAFKSMPCYNSENSPIWYVVSDILLFENSPIQIAFRRLSSIPTEAIFLKFEEKEE